MTISRLKLFFRALLSLLVASPLLFSQALPAQAGASIYVGGPASVQVGDVISVTISVNTGGQAANSYDTTFSYPSNLFDPVQGSTSGSVCSIWINTPDPSSNPGEIQCGSSTPLNGTGLIGTIKLKATTAGSGSFSLSGCQVLASDGKGTDITGGCTGSGVTVTSPPPPPPPPPVVAPVSSQQPTQQQTTTTTQSKATPKPASTAQQTPKPAEQPSTPTPTPIPPTPPPAQPLPTPGTPLAGAAATPAAGSSPSPNTSTSQKRTIATAFKDLLQSVKDFQKTPHDVPGLVAILLSIIPVLGLCLAIVFFIYRLYLLERRRKRTLDRLFEMELSELAALEGKLDLLAEKGSKGREEYRDEFKQAKEHILRQLRPDYGQPVDGLKKEKKEPITTDSPAPAN